MTAGGRRGREERDDGMKKKRRKSCRKGTREGCLNVKLAAFNVIWDQNVRTIKWTTFCMFSASRKYFLRV